MDVALSKKVFKNKTNKRTAPLITDSNICIQIGTTSLLEFRHGYTGHQGNLLRGVDMATVTEFQYVYTCSLLSGTQFIREQKWFKIAGIICAYIHIYIHVVPLKNIF